MINLRQDGFLIAFHLASQKRSCLVNLALAWVVGARRSAQVGQHRVTALLIGQYP